MYRQTRLQLDEWVTQELKRMMHLQILDFRATKWRNKLENITKINELFKIAKGMKNKQDRAMPAPILFRGVHHHTEQEQAEAITDHLELQFTPNITDQLTQLNRVNRMERLKAINHKY